MPLPNHCSAKVYGRECEIPPSYVLSVKSQEAEYMFAVVCDEHKSKIKKLLIAMQQNGNLPPGAIRFQPISGVATDCVIGFESNPT